MVVSVISLYGEADGLDCRKQEKFFATDIRGPAWRVFRGRPERSEESYRRRIQDDAVEAVVYANRWQPFARHAIRRSSLMTLRPFPLRGTRVDMAADPLDNPGALLQQVASGDRDAFMRFYERYASLAFTFALRLLGSRSDAEDLLQEVFLQVWHQARHYSPERGSPEAWLITMTRSRAIDRLRSMHRREMSSLSPDEPGRAAGGTQLKPATQASEAKLTVQGVLAKLPETQRTVLELAYFDGLTQSEIAARLGEPLGTVKTRMRTGLERLRGFLGAEPTGRSL
jgi:RNA polymerase sigma-70 factor, ECF subfamily